MYWKSNRSTLSYLECLKTGEKFNANELLNLSTAGAPLLARYDLDRAARTLRPENLDERRRDMWRYAKVLLQPSTPAAVTNTWRLTHKHVRSDVIPGNLPAPGP